MSDASQYQVSTTTDTSEAASRLAVKTTADRAAALQARLIAEHSYDVPEVIRTPIVAGNPAYLSWVEAETSICGQPSRPKGHEPDHAEGHAQ